MSNNKHKPIKTPLVGFAALHAKCMNSGLSCTGPGCRRERNYDYSTAAPRVKTRERKAEKRLGARIKGWELSQTAGNKPEHGQEMHKPGSQKEK